MKLSKDYKIEITKGSGPGGQHRNKVETCVKIIHIPTGLQEVCQDTRSKFKNIELAKERIIEKVNSYYKEIKDSETNNVRREQINNGERSFRRRTYNYKTQIVTDHKTGKKANLEKILNGELELLW